METTTFFTPEMILTICLFLLGGLFGVVWYLLRQKDAQQEESIKLLFKKHDLDEQKLVELRVQIAQNYYHKQELDYRFRELSDSFKDVGTRLERKFDELQKMLVTHVANQNNKGDSKNG
jgi:hypothetical protein